MTDAVTDTGQDTGEIGTILCDSLDAQMIRQTYDILVEQMTDLIHIRVTDTCDRYRLSARIRTTFR